MVEIKRKGQGTGKAQGKGSNGHKKNGKTAKPHGDSPRSKTLSVEDKVKMLTDRFKKLYRQGSTSRQSAEESLKDYLQCLVESYDVVKKIEPLIKYDRHEGGIVKWIEEGHLVCKKSHYYRIKNLDGKFPRSGKHSLWDEGYKLSEVYSYWVSLKKSNNVEDGDDTNKPHGDAPGSKNDQDDKQDDGSASQDGKGANKRRTKRGKGKVTVLKVDVEVPPRQAQHWRTIIAKARKRYGVVKDSEAVFAAMEEWYARIATVETAAADDVEEVAEEVHDDDGEEVRHD